jgi:sugar phosphate isomerase/epimerase
MSLPPISAQTIIFGKKYKLENDADVVFGALAKAGYAAAECSMKDPAVLKQKLTAHGLKHSAQHTTVQPLAENTQSFIDFAKAMGTTDICNSGFYQWKHNTVTDVGYSIKLLNEAGKKLRDAGIQLHYHNHDFEFQVKVLGKRLIDILIDELDPAACDFCMDVCWIHRGGDNPAEFLAKYNDRIGYLHFKDWDGTQFVPLGKGQVDFKSIMKVLPTMKSVRWMAIEQDTAFVDPIEDMAQSRKYLKDTFGY